MCRKTNRCSIHTYIIFYIGGGLYSSYDTFSLGVGIYSKEPDFADLYLEKLRLLSHLGFYKLHKRLGDNILERFIESLPKVGL